MAKALVILVAFISILFFSSFALADINIFVEVISREITLSVSSPENTTYTRLPILISGTTNIGGDIFWSMNGNENKTACLNCTSFSNLTSDYIIPDSVNYVTIYAINSLNTTNVDVETVYFTYSPPVLFYKLMTAGIIPLIMGAGFIFYLIQFIGLPSSPKELINYALIIVIIGIAVVSAIKIIGMVF
jgi:hypothetical protein